MINKHSRALIGAVLAGILFAEIPLFALSYTGIGEVTNIKRDTVGDGLLYSELYSKDENGKPQRSYILEYTPSEGTLPLVRCGSTVYGKDRVGSLVSAAAENGDTVFAAMNGDFYSMQTGVPMGIVIDGGNLVTSDDSRYALGLTGDGKAIIGKPSLSVYLTNDTTGKEAIKIDHVNKYPTVWGIYMVTDRFAATTLSADSSYEIVIELEDELTLNGSVKGIVTDVVTDGMNSGIPEGCAVITVSEDSLRYSDIAGMFEKGDEVTFDISCAEGWESVKTAVGGGDLILDSGIMPEGIIDEDHEKISNPRTAAGIKEDGTVVFFAVDGRTNASRGLNETELAQVMSELGCVTALNLDGGGSTTVMVKASDKESCVYVNIPSDSSYRSVANGILFVSAHAPDGEAARLSVYPNTPYILRNSKVDFTARALDKAYTPLDLYLSTDMLTASFKAEYPEDIGSIEGGSFMAGAVPGEYRLNLSSGEISGDVSVIVTDKLHDLKVTPEYIKVKPGSLVELDIDAVFNDREITATPSSFYYTLNGTHVVPDQKDYPGAMLLCDLGYLDMSGNFQTFGGEREGTVEVGVWFDEFVRYVTVNIGTGPDTVADFDSFEGFGRLKIRTTGEDLYLAATEGRRSAGALEFGFNYDTDKQTKLVTAELRRPIPMSKDAESVKLFAKGDISGVLTARVKDTDGNSYDLSYRVTKDYSKQNGWRELTAEIPASLKTGTLYLHDLLTVTDMGEGSRTIIIDDAIVFYGENAKTNLTGFETHWSAESLYTLYDMGVILDDDCTVSGDGLLHYDADKALSRGEFAKMLSLYSGIAENSYKTEGVKLEADTPEALIPYIRAAIDHGLMSGRGTSNDGTVIFDHGAKITREEAFKVISSILNASESELEFSDKSDIAEWAVSGVAECVGAGIVGGYDDNTIRPKATITRAELAAILTRMK